MHKKVSLAEENEGGANWNTIIENVSVKGKKGEVQKIKSGINFILLGLPLENEIEETETHIIQKYFPSTFMTFSQSILIMLTKALNEDEVNWLKLIKEDKYLINYDSFHNDIKDSIDEGLVDLVLSVYPYSDKQSI